MSRFFVTSDMVGERYITIQDRDDLHHMIKVLRLREGDEIDISDSEEWEYHAAISTLDSDCCEAVILDKQRFAREPSTKVTLFQGVPKQGKMELIIQKTVELGVHAIIPVFMERSVVKDNGKLGKKTERWRRVSGEAVKQCKRGIIPEVGEALNFSEMTGMLGEYDIVLLPYENEEGTTIKDVLRERKEGGTVPIEADGGAVLENAVATVGADGRAAAAKVAVIIGPEGGFAEKEVEAIVQAGGKSVSLGKTILRTETAGMAALAMIMYELEM